MSNPDDALRAAESRMVRFCPVEGTWQDDDDFCGWDECESRKHRKRRASICSKCSQAYTKKKEFDGHECYSAY